jgi:methionyl aminopeptidase
MLQVTKESLYVGIREFKAGNRVEDVGNAIQKYTESFGYGVVRELVGHGLGQKNARMPNYGKRGRETFIEGMVVAMNL